MKKQNSLMCYLQDTLLRAKDTQTESERQKMMLHANGNKKKSWFTILVTDKVNLKTGLQ